MVWGPEEGRADEETEAGDGVHPGFATRHVSAHRQTEGSHGPGAGPGLKRKPDHPGSTRLSAPLQAALDTLYKRNHTVYALWSLPFSRLIHGVTCITTLFLSMAE